MSGTDNIMESRPSPYVNSLLHGLGDPWPQIVRRVLYDCQHPPSGEVAASSEEVERAAYSIVRGISDCDALDSWEGGTFFTDRFQTAMIGPIAYAGVMCQVVKPFNKKQWRPVWDAMDIGETETKKARTIMWLRELVRDGIPPDDAFQTVSGIVATIVFEGNAVDFVVKIGAVVKEIKSHPEKYTRSLNEWIERAWVPLALWEMVRDPQGAHDILVKAAACYPPLQNRALSYQAFYKAWQTVKPPKPKDL